MSDHDHLHGRLHDGAFLPCRDCHPVEREAAVLLLAQRREQAARLAERARRMARDA